MPRHPPIPFVKAAPEFGAKAFLGEHNDIEPRPPRISGDMPLDRERIRRPDCARGIEQAPSPEKCLLSGHGRKEFGIIEVSGDGSNRAAHQPITREFIHQSLVTPLEFHLGGSKDECSSRSRPSRNPAEAPPDRKIAISGGKAT